MAMRISSVSPALAKEKAENADLSKSTFLANMSHEIRTPLNAITGFAEILASANTEEEKAQYQEIIKMNADLLMQLVNDILDMSKIEAGTLEFVQTTVDVNLLLSDLQQLFQMRVNEAGENIQIIAEPSRSSCMIQTDRNRVAQVLSNFAGNAIKFTHEGSIRIGYEARDTELYFYVKDTGAGIPAEKLSDVFERFVKLNKDTRAAEGQAPAVAHIEVQLRLPRKVRLAVRPPRHRRENPQSVLRPQKLPQQGIGVPLPQPEHHVHRLLFS